MELPVHYSGSERRRVFGAADLLALDLGNLSKRAVDLAGLVDLGEGLLGGLGHDRVDVLGSALDRVHLVERATREPGL